MGWDSIRLNGQSPLTYILDEVNSNNWKVLASHQDKDGTIYMAVNRPKVGPQVIAFVVVVEQNPNGYTYFKWIGEDEGPYYWGANHAVLSKLTPPYNDYAKSWREQCQQRQGDHR